MISFRKRKNEKYLLTYHDQSIKSRYTQESGSSLPYWEYIVSKENI